MRRCEIDKIGIDIPCMHKAPHFLKVVSKHIGDRGKMKFWICDRHHKMLLEEGSLTNLFDNSDKSSADSSDEYTASLH